MTTTTTPGAADGAVLARIGRAGEDQARDRLRGRLPAPRVRRPLDVPCCRRDPTRGAGDRRDHASGHAHPRGAARAAPGRMTRAGPGSPCIRCRRAIPPGAPRQWRYCSTVCRRAQRADEQREYRATNGDVTRATAARARARIRADADEYARVRARDNRYHRIRHNGGVDPAYVAEPGEFAGALYAGGRAAAARDHADARAYERARSAERNRRHRARHPGRPASTSRWESEHPDAVRAMRDRANAACRERYRTDPAYRAARLTRTAEWHARRRGTTP